jgi:hypothetical protein
MWYALLPPTLPSLNTIAGQDQLTTREARGEHGLSFADLLHAYTNCRLNRCLNF